MNMRVTGSYPAGLTSPVDKRIGDAFPVIEEVHRYLDQLKYLAKNGEKFAGKQVEFRSNSEEEAIEWRYENGEWNVLVSFNELVGININSIEARVELLIETARQAIEQTAHQVATEAADAVSAQFTAVVEAQVASVEALKQETVDAYQAGLAAKVSAEEAAVTAATFAENADVSAAESATSANEAEASANAAELSAQNAAAHKVEAGNQAVAAEASATAATEKLGEVSTLHGAVMAASTTASEAAETTATHLVQITALHSAAETFAQAAQLSAEQADSAATAAGVSASDALQFRNETQGFHDAASTMVVDAAQVSADRATVQSLVQEVQLAANQAESNALAAAASADTAVASANAAADSATIAQTSASEILGQVTTLTGRLDEADSIVTTVTALRDETLSYKLAAQDSTVNAQAVAADRAAVADMMGTIAADAASAADSKNQAMTAAASAEQAEVAANTVLTEVQNTAQEIEDSITAAQDVWNAKQDTLVSGTNIKTINGESLLGGGDLVVSGSSNGGQDMPIGGITWMHPEFAPDEFTDNAQRFVRTGTAVAFEPGGKHDAALAAGFGLYDSVKKVGYADVINILAITCVGNVSGSLTLVKDKVVFTPWFNSSGVGVLEFPQHPEVQSITYSHNSYCWSPVLQTWLVGYVKPTAEGKRELCVDRLSRGKWVETYRIDSGVAINTVYVANSFACSSQDTAIFEFTLNGLRYELAIALDTNGAVIGKVLKNEPSIQSNYRRWFAGKDGYVIASKTTANPTVSTFFSSSAETVRQEAVAYKPALQMNKIFDAGATTAMWAVYHEGVWVLLFGNSSYPYYQNTVVTSITGLWGPFTTRVNLSGSYADISMLAYTESGWVGYNSDSQYNQVFITSPDGVSWTTKNKVSAGNVTLLNPLFKDSFVTNEGVYTYSGSGVVRTSTSFAFRGMAANDHGQVFAFSNGIIGFIPHDRQNHLMNLVYTYNSGTGETTFCKTVNGQFFVYMTGVGLLTSTNGVDWAVLVTGLINYIYDVEYLSGTYVVTGAAYGGKNFAYSTDLNSWTTGYIRTTGTIVLRLLNTGERLVALCSTGTAYSETGIEWIQGNSGNFNNTVRSGLVHDGVIDVFMYYNISTVIQWQSVDGGATFTSVKTVTLPTSGNSFLDMCIRKGKWWAIRGDFVYSSSDGNSWSPEPLADVPISNPYPQLIEVNGELRFMTGHDSWLVLDSDSNVPALVGTKLEVVQESGAVGFIRIE